jgi:sulfate transport system ATP-binding protein
VSIRIEDVTKAFGRFAALDGVSLDVPDGDLLALLGPSGSGKTTLLRIIAGLEVADSGKVRLGGEDITQLSPRERNVGFVFQHYALFRHMTVADNVGYGLRVRGTPKAKIRARVKELLGLVRLEGLDERYPSQLSGGQRQRVALARALAMEPKVLLLDEPFGALDAKVRQELRDWLRKLHDELHVTSIFVTHDQQEAMELADRVVVMNRGRIEQIGSTDELYERPATPFVFDFLGSTNVLPAEIRDHRLVRPDDDRPLATHPWRSSAVHSLTTERDHRDGPIDIYVRPSDLRIAERDAPGVPVRIESVQRTGPTVRASAITIEDGVPLAIELPHLHHDVTEIVPGASVRLRMMLFSLFPPSERLARAPILDAPDPIGRPPARVFDGPKPPGAA